jgi:23S rRNA (pseudouridine1915-N3)-methyltransferase
MKITVVAVGKIKEKFYTQAIEEYTKRLSRYCKLQIVQVQDEKTPDEASEREETQIKDREGDKILRALPEDAYVIALAINGKTYDSPGLARHMEQLMTGGRSHIVFVIGGSLGLSDQVLSRADEKLSFSALTFPHQLMRVILLEQVYRSFRIMNHEPYHK